MYFEIIFGILAAIVAIVFLHQLASSAEFQKTKGKIITSNVSTQREVNGGSNTVKYSYSFNLEYSYEVGGKEYKGTQLTGIKLIPNNFNNRIDAEIPHEKYPLNSEVSVYFDKNDPSHACLEVPKSKFKMLLLGYLMIILVFTLIVFFSLILNNKIDPTKIFS